MRIVAVSAPEGDRQVVWENVVGVRYLAKGRQRWIVITYRNGGERNLEVHQARDLYWEIAPTVPCEPPCFFGHECDKAPDSCPECQMAENLIPLVGEVRPNPIPPWRGKEADWRNVALVIMAFLIVLLIGVAAQSPAPPRSTTTRVSGGSRGTGKPVGEVSR